ncbi:MAG: hypothetical protein QNL01_05755 [Akkermansiaceae bacterium]|jgi:hypothetical protein
MKTLLFSTSLLFAIVLSTQAAMKPVEVSMDTPSSGWSLKIKSAHTRNNKLLVVCQLSHAGGVSLTVISKVKDSIQLPEKQANMKREIYVLGKTWNWGKGYTAVTPEQLKIQLKDSQAVYTAKNEKGAKEPAAKIKENDSDFVNLKYKDAVALAKKRKLKYRIVKKDGRSLPVTMDHRPNRLNFTLVKDIVTAVRRG